MLVPRGEVRGEGEDFGYRRQRVAQLCRWIAVRMVSLQALQPVERGASAALALIYENLAAL